MKQADIYWMIMEIMPELTKAEKRVAKTLMADFPAAGLSSMVKLAEAAQVSDPTIMRFIRKLGYGSFLDFKSAMMSGIADRSTSPLSFQQNEVQLKKVNNEADGFANRLIKNIVITANQISDREIISLLEILRNKKKNILIGGGEFTFSMARHAFFHLAKMRPRVSLIEDLRFLENCRLLDVTNNDILVAFDVRRYSQDLVRIARDFHKRGGLIILFTDQWLSPISALAKHVFACRIDSDSRWDSLAGILMVVEFIMHCYTEMDWDYVEHRLKEAETLTRITR